MVFVRRGVSGCFIKTGYIFGCDKLPITIYKYAYAWADSIYFVGLVGIFGLVIGLGAVSTCNSPSIVDTLQPQHEVFSKAPGLTPPIC